MSTSYYSPMTGTDRNTMARIDAAAKYTGKRSDPHPAMILRQRISEAPATTDVAAALAREAMTLDATTDLDQWHADALDRIREAQAADTLRASFNTAWHDAQRAVAAAMVTQAVKDSQRSFAATVKALTDTTAHLPQTNPLDPETNIRADTGQHLTAAREALAALAIFGALVMVKSSDSVPPALMKVLPIIDIPQPTVELRNQWLDSLNPDELEVTNVVRDLAAALREDTDETLVRIARGDFPGVTFSLATSADYQDRAARARDAFISRRPKNNG